MAYIKKLKYNELVGGTDNTDVYPVTSTEAVYGPDNINQQTVNEDRLRRIELLESNVQSLDGLKEMVEAFISGDYDYQGGLSDNNFTDELKAKLEGLENYNDTELRQLLADIDTAKANAADVYTKNEIDDKLGDIQGALTFDSTPIAGSDNPVKSSGIYTALQGKQDTISDIANIRSGAAAGATAYQKPSAGIPKSDLSTDVQSSLNKADTALQSYNETDPVFSASPAAGITSNDIMEWDGKQSALTFDSIPTASSINPVTSGGVMAALDLKANQSTTYTKTEVDNKLADGVYVGSTVGTDIKQLKDKNNVVFYPQTHTKAVVDDNGYTAESRLQAMQDEINQAQLEVGAVPSDLTPTEGSTYWVTSGGVYNALQNIQSELYNEVDLLSMLAESNGFIDSAGKWSTVSGYRGGYIDVSDLHGETVKITANSNYVSVYAFTKDKVTTNNTAMSSHYATGSAKTEIAIGTTESVVVPDDAAYLYVYMTSNSTVRTPSSISVKLSASRIDLLEEKCDSYDILIDKVIDTQNSQQYSLAPSKLKWTGGTGYQKYCFLDASTFKRRKIHVQWNGNKTRIFPVTGISGVNDRILFSEEPREYILDTGRTSCEIYIEDSCNYLAFQSVSKGGVDISPTFTLLADAVSTYEFEEERNITPISLTDQCRTAFSRSADYSSWNILANTHSSSYLVDVSKCKGGTIYITQENVAGSMFFITEDNREQDASILYAGNDGLISTTIGVLIPYKIPTDANYVNIIEMLHNGTDQHPTEIYLSPLPSSSSPSSDTYSNIYLNVVKKAKQMTNLKWTAKQNIAGTYCTAGEKTGLLYSSCVETDRYVGHDVSMRTFMTCANNPYSLLYTENLATRTSDYGFTYVGRRGTIHAWMGTVCSRFTASCCGMDREEWDTAYMAWLCEEGIFTKIYDQSGQGVEVGDWIWISGHVRIITDVKKSDGLVTSITVSEAVQPLCSVVNYTPTTLNTYLSSNHGIIYRYNELYKNVKYEPSPFIAVDDEVLSGEYVYNNDICTYAGDYAAFYEGFPVWINYNLSEVGAWTQMQVYKNDVLVGTYNIDTSVHRFNLTEAYGSLGYGKWKARLTDGTNYSDYTYWEVIETNVAYTTPDANTPNVKKVTFSSSNGTPTRVVFCEQDGTPMAVRPLSIAERMDGYVVFNPVAYCKAQRGGNLGSGTYLRVYFVGEYGRVSNAQILTDIGSN